MAMSDLELIEIIQKLNTFTEKELKVFADITIHDGLRKYANDLILEKIVNRFKQADAAYQKLLDEVDTSLLD